MEFQCIMEVNMKFMVIKKQIKFLISFLNERVISSKKKSVGLLSYPFSNLWPFKNLTNRNFVLLNEYTLDRYNC
jgi:hypothetical protein